jgi:predicted nucleic acid-binding protein
MIVLLDTCVLVDALNHRAGRQEFLLNLVAQGHTLASCAITVAEIYAGMRPREAQITADWLGSLRYLDTPEPTAKMGGDLRAAWKSKGHTLSATDTLIAAVAIAHGATLATDNLKDFPMPELRLLPLPRPN